MKLKLAGMIVVAFAAGATVAQANESIVGEWTGNWGYVSPTLQSEVVSDPLVFNVLTQPSLVGPSASASSSVSGTFYDPENDAFGNYPSNSSNPNHFNDGTLSYASGTYTFSWVGDFGDDWVGTLNSSGTSMSGLWFIPGDFVNGACTESSIANGDCGTWSVNSVPEPATLSLLGIGLAGVGFMRRRNAK